jgi:hypothetical protein
MDAKACLASAAADVQYNGQRQLSVLHPMEPMTFLYWLEMAIAAQTKLPGARGSRRARALSFRWSWWEKCGYDLKRPAFSSSYHA